MRRQLARTSLVFLLLSMFFIQGQTQSCGLRDTFIVTQNSNLSFDINIIDYFNDDLADPAQGLCGVELGFVHQLVENLEITLTSPGGQSINLIGPNSNDELDFTIGTEWQIDFVPCGEAADPDPFFSPQWDNTQTENWVNFGRYFGSYYPFMGCLEDFDTGPVNGNWTLTLNNNPSNSQGAVTFLNLIFCDSRGVECCFTTPGTILNESIIACQGADTLLIDPRRDFPMGMADTIDFGYAYLISEGGVYTQIDSLLDFRDSLAGQYQVCGFSYRRDELMLLPEPDNILTIDDIRTNLTGLTPWLCAELTMDCLDVQVIAPPDTTFLEERICVGDSVFVGLDTFTMTGVYDIDLLSYVNCDSIVRLDLFVQDVQFIELDSIICSGDSAMIGSSVYYDTGLYQDTLASVELGCDSIVTFSLLVIDTLFTDLDSVVCMGETISVGDSLLRETGYYEIPLLSTAGCDSIVRVDLQVLDPIAVIENILPIDCNNPMRTLSAGGSTPFPELSFRWLNELEVLLGQASTLEVDTAGTYILEVSQLLNDVTCVARDTILVRDVRVFPIADAGPDTTLTCTNPVISIGGDLTTFGDEFTYEWQQLVLGHFVGDPMSRHVDVDSAGVYQLIVTNVLTGCPDSSIVEVFSDQESPQVDTGLGFELNCLVLQDTLDGSASLVEPDFVLTWSGDCVNEVIAPGLAVIDCPGEYILDVFNPNNGCRAENTIVITQHIELPQAIVEEPDVLDCEILSVTLNGSNSNPLLVLDYEWHGPESILLTGTQTETGLPGIYELIVIRQDNFCRDTTEFELLQDILPPVADIQADSVITCGEPTILLEGPLTSVGPEYVYQWLENGLPVDDGNTDSLRVNIFGTYNLIVENTVNACRDTAMINVTEDLLPPELVQAGVNRLLDCDNLSIQLLPDSTLYSEPVSFSWTGPCVLEPDDIWGVNVDCVGTYYLQVTNDSNGCFGVDSVDVHISENYSIAQTPESLYLSCETGTVEIDTEGSSNGIRRWFLDDVLQFFPDQNPTVSQPGIYTLIITNALGTCSDTASVEVLVECDVRAIIVEPDTITCRDQSILIDASNSLGGGELSYLWSSLEPLCIIGPTNEPFLEVVCSGDYQVIVSNVLIDQHDTLSVTVLSDIVMPVVEAGENIRVDCIQIQANLLGTVVGNSQDYTFAWTNTVLDTLSEVESFITISSGTYFFTAEKTSNGCRASDVVQVTVDTITPGIAFGDRHFGCDQDTFLLSAFVMPPDGNYTYQWAGPSVLVDNDSLTAVIGSLGFYSFKVTDEDNGCDSAAIIQVLPEICAPCLTIGEVDTLDCQTEMITIEAEFCMPCIGCDIEWFVNDEIITDANSLSLQVSEGGSYTIRVTDLLGQMSEMVVEVIELTEGLTFSLGPDLSFNCDSSCYTLYPMGSTTEPPLLYEWFRLGEIDVISNDSQLVVTEIGDYRLLITEPLTGCFASDTINIGMNFIAPIAEAGDFRTITCSDPAVVLDAGNSTLAGATYQWTGPTPACITGDQSLNPIVSCSGWYYLEVRNIDNGCTSIDSVRVFVDEGIPDLVPVADTTITCSNLQIDLIGNVPADGGNYEFTWCELDEFDQEITSSCQPTMIYEVTNQGRFEFTVENTDTGCSNSFIVNVTVDTLASFAEAGDQDTLFCFLSSLELAAMADENTTYSWSNSEGHPIENPSSLTPLIFQPGWYVLEVENQQNGCITIDSVQIHRDEETPTLDAGLDTLLDCRNDQIELSAVGETASGQAEWLWSTVNGQIDYGIDSPNAGVSDTAWYFIRLTDPVNGCEITDSLFVGEDLRTPQAILADIDDLRLNCLQDTLLLDASASINHTGVGLEYQWVISAAGSIFPDMESEQVFTDSSGVYQLFVEDIGNGCRDTLSFNVSADFSLPNLVFAIPDTLTCSIDNIQLETIVPATEDGFVFEWFDSEQDLISNDSFATAQTSGWHSLLLLEEENGCSTLDSIFVETNEASPTVVIHPPLPINCEREWSILDASDSSQGVIFDYQWTALDGGALLGNAVSVQDSTRLAGLYQLKITNTATGCADSSQVMVQSEGQPIIGLDVEVENPPCEGDLLGSISINEVMGGTPDFLYSINNQSQDNLSFFEDLPVGTYDIKVEDAQGCYWIETVEVFPATEFQIDLGPNEEIQLGDSLQLTPESDPVAESFLWIAPDLHYSISGMAPFVRPLETQFIILEATNAAGCVARDTIQIFVRNTRPNFIPTAFSPNGDDENDEFVIYTGQDVKEVKVLRIFSRWGNMVFEQKNFAPNDPNLGWDGTLNGTPLNTGVFVYYIEMLYEDNWVEVKTGDVLLMR